MHSGRFQRRRRTKNNAARHRPDRRPRQRLDDAVRADIADEARRRARHQAAQRGVDAAALGIAQQRRHAGRAGHADLHRPGNAAGAQLLEPGQDALGRKRELADDMDAQALRRRGGDLLVERGFEPPGGNARMAFRIGADADLFDAGFAQAAFLDHRQRVGKGSRGRRRRRRSPASRRTSASPRRPASRFVSGRRPRGCRRAAIWTTGSRPALRSNAAAVDQFRAA